ncbi:MAG: peptidoglycan-binding domain-containing protein, partial [Alphaproteobacteria bacterium]|nr:peptidoglycan-binding domain-containing protein [Alphaproteobacteria bacterium]
RLGYYKLPPHGISPYPDKPLFSAIKHFQADNNLKVDGIMKPGGETENALISMGGDGYGPYVCGAPIYPREGSGNTKIEYCQSKHGGANQYCRKCTVRLGLKRPAK